MAKATFGAGATPVEEQQAAQAVAPVQSTCMAVSRPQGFVLGDYLPSFDQITLPRVNIAQNIGKLQDTFESGSIILGQQTVLWLPPDITSTGVVNRPADPPVIMTCLGFRPTRYVEKTVGGARGIIVNTPADVVAAGGTLDYQEWKLKRDIKLFEYLVDACVIIERPDSVPDDDTVFIHEVEGKKYTMALWALKGSCYTALAKNVWFTHRKMGPLMSKEVKVDGKGTGQYTGGYPTFSYQITTFEKPFNTGNKSWVPVALPYKKNTEAFLDFVRTILEPPPQSAA